MLSSGRSSGRKFTRANLNRQLGAVAIAAYTRAIEKNPDDPKAYRKRAKWHEQLGHKDLAAADLASAAKRETTLAMSDATGATAGEPATNEACADNHSTDKPFAEANEQQAPLVVPVTSESLAIRLWVIGALLIVVAAVCAIIKMIRLGERR